MKTVWYGLAVVLGALAFGGGVGLRESGVDLGDPAGWLDLAIPVALGVGAVASWRKAAVR